MNQFQLHVYQSQWCLNIRVRNVRNNLRSSLSLNRFEFFVIIGERTKTTSYFLQKMQVPQITQSDTI